MMRFNYKRANWIGFTQELDTLIDVIPLEPKYYDKFISSVWTAAKRNIPRGYFKSYVPGFDDTSKHLYAQYTRAYDSDPFAEATIELGETLLTSLSEFRGERWEELVTSIDMTRNSKKAWKVINRLNSDSQPEQRCPQVTPNQVASQLLLNGKPSECKLICVR